jgi:hypothetical protein
MTLQIFEVIHVIEITGLRESSSRQELGGLNGSHWPAAVAYDIETNIKPIQRYWD